MMTLPEFLKSRGWTNIEGPTLYSYEGGYFTPTLPAKDRPECQSLGTIWHRKGKTAAAFTDECSPSSVYAFGNGATDYAADVQAYNNALTLLALKEEMTNAR